MKRYLHYFILLFAVLGIVAGCKKDDPAVKNALESDKLIQNIISGVSGPTTGKINQELVFNIIWDNADTTQTFNHLQDSTFHNTKIIKLFTSTKSSDTTLVYSDTTLVYKGGNTILYKFKSASAGIYYLKFYKPDNTDKSAIIDTIRIVK